MRRKHLFLAIAALLAAGGLWFARTTWRTQASEKSSMDVSVKMPSGGAKRAPTHRPPDPTRRYRELTPEQRVKHARQPQGG